MRGTPILFYQSLNRPFNIMGINKRLFFLVLLFPGSFFMSGIFLLNIKHMIVGVVIFAIGAPIAWMITKADQDVIPIYRRHIAQKKYYAPLPAYNAKVKRPINSVPSP